MPLEDDDDDLIGGPPQPAKRGRPPKPRVEPDGARARRMARQDAAAQLEQLTSARRTVMDGETAAEDMVELKNNMVMHGVTASLLAQIFRTDPRIIRNKLRDVPPIRIKKAGAIYDLKTAAEYIVKPKINVDEYIRNMRPSELPTTLQDAYWSAQRKKQAYDRDAGNTWHTEQVLEVLGDVFKTIKNAMQLWPDNVERETGITPEQRVLIVAMGDALQEDIRQRLVEMPKLKQTRSTLHDEHYDPEDRPPVEEMDDDDLI